MKCPKIKLVSPYIDGELSGKDRTLFESHLALCPSCSQRLEGFRRMHDGFLRAEKHQAPYGFSSRVMAGAMSRDQRKWGWLLPAFTRFAEAAVVLVMITAGIVVGGFLMNAVMGRQMTSVASSFSLDVFDPAPPDSMGGVYLAMTEARYEK